MNLVALILALTSGILLWSVDRLVDENRKLQSQYDRKCLELAEAASQIDILTDRNRMLEDACFDHLPKTEDGLGVVL